MYPLNVMIIFKKVRAKNFLSIGNSYFDYDLNKDHITLLRGKNGEGKSQISDLLTFGLYKKAYRNINLPQLVNNINQKDCVVEVEFSIGNTEWKVVRGLSPNIFEIYKDNQILDQHSSIIEQQKWFEQNVLKMSYKTFVQIVILGSSAYIPFMQLTPADRRDVIEDLLDIKLFSSMHAHVKEKIKDFKEQVKILNIKKDSFVDKVEMQKNFIEQIEQRSRSDIDNKTTQITTLFEIIENLQQKASKLDDNIERQRQTLTDLLDSTENLKRLQSEKTKVSLQAQGLKEGYKFFKDHDICPTCSQNIDENLRKQKIKESKKELNALKETYQSIIETIDIETGRYETYQSINNTINSLVSEQRQVNYEIASSQKEIKQLHKQIKDLNSQIENKNTEHEKLNEYDKELDNIKETIIQTKEDIHLHEYALTLLKDSGVKSKIVEKYLKIINQQINKYLEMLELYVNFTLDSEFNEIITTPTFERFSYGNFSEGQKRRVDLALLFTWRYITAIKNSASTNLLICDEILDGSLDEMGHFAFLKIIKEEMKNTNIFVISHREGIEHRFDNVITVEKRGNFSYKSES